MITTLAPGLKLDGQWQSMSWLKKELLVYTIISYLIQLFQKCFKRIGNLYTTKDLQAHSSADIANTILLGLEHSFSGLGLYLSEVTSIPFFWGNVDRGPFERSQDWLRACLGLYLSSAEDPVTVVRDPEDDSDSNSLRRTRPRPYAKNSQITSPSSNQLTADDLLNQRAAGDVRTSPRRPTREQHLDWTQPRAFQYH